MHVEHTPALSKYPPNCVPQQTRSASSQYRMTTLTQFDGGPRSGMQIFVYPGWLQGLPEGSAVEWEVELIDFDKQVCVSRLL